ncbi:xanthine phosphoribosyltransferase 1 [[Candida] jaroonii]|uniref:Xanthine phosphoribosyltransferase 1 n=1 Tax=[Candida] jaroonii TaxID=467808 RepID=A0ACA9Y0G9_9ASCO|nr:xanthine phosphoribosyltransferase 1 [[Candida] jaroonii]
MEGEDQKLYISYELIHKLCQQAAKEIKASGKTIDLIIAIGGGGFIPARILRSFIKEKGKKNIPIQAIGLSLYEQLTDSPEEQIGKEVIRTQWIDFGNLSQHFDSLIGKNIIIVDEVDDTRTTLHYALTELEKDVKEIQKKLGREDETTEFSIFVLHNKEKEKRAELPKELFAENRYIVGQNVPDKWIAYPWEALDIDTHTEKARLQGNI